MAVGHKVSTGFLLFLWFRCAPKSNGATHFRNVVSYCLGKESLLKSEILTTKWGMFSLLNVAFRFMFPNRLLR